MSNAKTGKEVTTVSQADIDAFFASRGSSVSQTRINSIELVNNKMDDEGNVNPDFGKLFAVSYDDEAETREEIDIATAQFFPAKFRVQITCRDYDEVDGKQKARYWCQEEDDSSHIQLKNQAGEVVFEGRYLDAKETYNLRYIDVVYVYYNDKIYRWKISAASFDTWFPVKKIVGSRGRFLTFKVNSINPQKNGTVWYNSMVFGIGQEFPIEKAIEVGKLIDENLSNYYKQKQADAEKADNVKALKQATDDVFGDIPPIVYVSNVKPEDVPF